MKKAWRVFAYLVVIVAVVLAARAFLGELSATPDKVGLIEIKGVIASSQGTLSALKKLREDPAVRAIVLRVESPGGGVGPSQEIYREVRKTIDVKPVVASLGAVAASGGYYVACGATRILANPGTITGSIGVILPVPNWKELLEKIGYHTVTVKSGKFKDIASPERDMTPEERALLQELINGTHAQFVAAIVEGRKLPPEEVSAFSDGRIMNGETALRLRMLDELGNFEDALRVAANLGKIEGDYEVVRAEKKRFSLLEWVLGDDTADKLQGLLLPDPLQYRAPWLP